MRFCRPLRLDAVQALGGSSESCNTYIYTYIAICIHIYIHIIVAARLLRFRGHISKDSPIAFSSASLVRFRQS